MMDMKMLAAVAAIALLSAMVGGYMMQQAGVKAIREEVSNMPLQTPAQAVQTPANTAQVSATPQATPSTPTTKRGVKGEIVMNEELTFTSLPWEKAVNLAKGRYEVYFEADQPIKFMISGSGSTKVTTQFGAKCCETSGFYTVDINDGEDGTYKIVFDDSQLQLADTRPSQGLVKIGKSSI